MESMNAGNEGARPGVLKSLRRLIVGLVGSTVLIIGIALLVLPGPAFIIIPLGLAILALEFAWARRILTRVRDWISRRRSKPS